MASLGALSGAITAAIKAAFPLPTKPSSWLAYNCWTEIEVDSGVVIGTTLPSEPITPTGNATHWDALNTQSLPTNVPITLFAPLAEILNAAQDQVGNGEGAEVFTQQQTSPIIIIYLVGTALRCGYPIPVPEIVSIGGVEPVLVNRLDHGEGFRQGVVGMTDVPVYGANWRLRYVLTGTLPTGTVPVPPNILS